MSVVKARYVNGLWLWACPYCAQGYSIENLPKRQTMYCEKHETYTYRLVRP